MSYKKVIFLLSCFILLLLGVLPISAWELSEHQGVTYVPVREMRTVYGLTEWSKQGRSWVLKSNKNTKKSQYREVSLRCGCKDMYMNRVRFALSHSVIEIGGELYISATDIAKIVDPVLRPQFIKNAGSVKTVVLDPGHGGHDAGARNSFVREADINLALAKKLKVLLVQSGYKVHLTRETDVFLTLQERVNYANKFPHAIFVSIHHNSGGSGAHGIETFTLAPVGTSTPYSKNVRSIPLSGNAQDSMNIALATAVQGYVVKATGAEDRGIKRAHFSVLCTIKHPAVLFEGGFVSNDKEARRISDSKYQDLMAKNMLAGINAYRNVVSKNGGSARLNMSHVASTTIEKPVVQPRVPPRGVQATTGPAVAVPTFNRGRKSCVID